MSEKLLIVEDDKKLNDGIRLALKNDSYFFYQCQTLQKAREILKKEDITLVLLDVNLPDMNSVILQYFVLNKEHALYRIMR